MNIGILGSGAVGRAFATRFTALGHTAMIGTRSVTESLQNNQKFREYLDQNPAVKAGSFADTASFGDIIINVTKGMHSLEALVAAGSENMSGKILIDVSNPLDTSQGFPSPLMAQYSNTHSLGEEIQNHFPETHVVKTLNTMWNGLMINPSLISDGQHINFICGNNTGAKDTVRKLLHELGWKDEYLIDLGDISNARGTEGILPLWQRLYGVMQTAAFNFNIVRQ